MEQQQQNDIQQQRAIPPSGPIPTADGSSSESSIEALPPSPPPRLAPLDEPTFQCKRPHPSSTDGDDEEERYQAQQPFARSGFASYNIPRPLPYLSTALPDAPRDSLETLTGARPATKVEEMWQCCHCVPSFLPPDSNQFPHGLVNPDHHSGVREDPVWTHFIVLGATDSFYTAHTSLRKNVSRTADVRIVPNFAYAIPDNELQWTGPSKTDFCKAQHARTLQTSAKNDDSMEVDDAGEGSSLAIGYDEYAEAEKLRAKRLRLSTEASPHVRCDMCPLYDRVTYYPRRALKSQTEQAVFWRVVCRLPRREGERFKTWTDREGKFTGEWRSRMDERRWCIGDGVV